MAFYPLQLRQTRAARRWTLQDAATASGLSVGTIAKWERQADDQPVAARTQTLNKYISLYELARQRFIDTGATVGVVLQIDSNNNIFHKSNEIQAHSSGAGSTARANQARRP